MEDNNQNNMDYLKTLLEKHGHTNVRLEEKEHELRHRLEMMECSMPAMLLSILNKAGSKGINAQEFISQLNQKFDGKSGGVIGATESLESSPSNVLESTNDDDSKQRVSIVSKSSSVDLDYIKHLYKLVLKEKQLKNIVTEMEHKEQVYMETLRIADELWADMENKYRNKLDNVQKEGAEICEQLQVLNEQLLAENQQLIDEVKDVKLELKHCKEISEGPLLRQLEREKRHVQELEVKLSQVAESSAIKECMLEKQICSMQTKYDTCCDRLRELNGRNKQLQSDKSHTECKYKELQQELIQQKISEAHTLQRMSEALCKEPAREDETVFSGSTLGEVSKGLRKAISNVENCGGCTDVPDDLIDTAKGLKNLCDIVGGKRSGAPLAPAKPCTCPPPAKNRTCKKIIANDAANNINVTTTVTTSGCLEVTTEGPAGIIETSISYTDSGNIEVVTDLTEFTSGGVQGEKCKKACGAARGAANIQETLLGQKKAEEPEDELHNEPLDITEGTGGVQDANEIEIIDVRKIPNEFSSESNLNNKEVTRNQMKKSILTMNSIHNGEKELLSFKRPSPSMEMEGNFNIPGDLQKPNKKSKNYIEASLLENRNKFSLQFINELIDLTNIGNQFSNFLLCMVQTANQGCSYPMQSGRNRCNNESDCACLTCKCESTKPKRKDVVSCDCNACVCVDCPDSNAKSKSNQCKCDPTRAYKKSLADTGTEKKKCDCLQNTDTLVVYAPGIDAATDTCDCSGPCPCEECLLRKPKSKPNIKLGVDASTDTCDCSQSCPCEECPLRKDSESNSVACQPNTKFSTPSVQQSRNCECKDRPDSVVKVTAPSQIAITQAHSKSCKCKRCLCSPCSYKSTSNEHPPDCKCPQCACSPKCIPAPVTVKEHPIGTHPPGCTCDQCVCSPECIPEQAEQQSTTALAPQSQRKPANLHPNCTCSDCICDPCILQFESSDSGSNCDSSEAIRRGKEDIGKCPCGDRAINMEQRMSNLPAVKAHCECIRCTCDKCYALEKHREDIAACDCNPCLCDGCPDPTIRKFTIKNDFKRCQCGEKLEANLEQTLSGCRCSQIHSTGCACNPCSARDNEKTQLKCDCQYQGEDDADGEQPQVPCPSLRITGTKKVTADGLLVKWISNDRKNLIGYEIFVNGQLVCRVPCPRRTLTLLHPVDFESSVNLSVYAVTPKGRCEPPATTVFEVP